MWNSGDYRYQHIGASEGECFSKGGLDFPKSDEIWQRVQERNVIKRRLNSLIIVFAVLGFTALTLLFGLEFQYRRSSISGIIPSFDVSARDKSESSEKRVDLTDGNGEFIDDGKSPPNMLKKQGDSEVYSIKNTYETIVDSATKQSTMLSVAIKKAVALELEALIFADAIMEIVKELVGKLKEQTAHFVPDVDMRSMNAEKVYDQYIEDTLRAGKKLTEIIESSSGNSGSVTQSAEKIEQDWQEYKVLHSKADDSLEQFYEQIVLIHQESIQNSALSMEDVSRLIPTDSAVVSNTEGDSQPEKAVSPIGNPDAEQMYNTTISETGRK